MHRMRLLLVVLSLAPAALAQTSRPTTQPLFQVGTIADPAIRENSGLIPAKTPGVFWTLNDSGNPPMLFAVNAAGKTLASVRVDARNIDWEDLANDDEGNLYIADVGNNTGRRTTVYVHRVAEPDVNAAPAVLKVSHTWALTFSAKPFDCEALFIYKAHGYLLSKYRDGTPTGLYRFALSDRQAPAVLEKVCDLPVRFPVTAADISRDGRRVAVLTVGGPYLFDLATPGDVASIARTASRSVLYTDVDMEAACLTPDGLLASTEKGPMLLFRWKDFGGSPPLSH
jgi:hypothetical protein